MAVDSVNFASVKKMLKSPGSASVYLIHGEEGYYVDALLEQAEALVAEQDRDFNLYVLYAPETDSRVVVDICNRYPMMADYQVVVLKEAQAVPAKYFEPITEYVRNQSPTTVLVIGGRGETVKSTAVATAIKKAGGVVFQSNKLKDAALASAIQELVKSKGLSIETKALSMLSDWIGGELSRVYKEIDKLAVTLPAGSMITPEVVERNVGISKDYNNFELVAALADRDPERTMKIIKYFQANQKANPGPVVSATVYNYFSNMLIAFYTPDKSERGLMAALGFKWPGQLRDITRGMRNYNAAQVVQILDIIREYDNWSKGNGSRMDMGDLLTDMVYRILTANGRLNR